jgi:(p)ppGpp synthase/HD superfamily hydrolase
MSEVEARHKKQLAVMRGWLEGRQFYQAMDALELVRKLEQGTRKDGETPKFHHQLSVTRLLTTLVPHMRSPEATLTVAILHDVLEDHFDKWPREALTERFGAEVSDAVWKLSKKSGGIVKTADFYFEEIGTCPIASLVKPADRAHNLQTMEGVFPPQKQLRYVQVVEDHFYPMLKIARRAFPNQYGAYENLKILLRCQCRLIQAIHRED